MIWLGKEHRPIMGRHHSWFRSGKGWARAVRAIYSWNLPRTSGDWLTYRGTYAYSLLVVIRRILSITVIAVLVSSPLLSATPMSGAEAGHSMSCHRSQTHESQHHCAGMQAEEADTPATNFSAATILSDKCPMQCCCGQANATKHAAVLGDSGSLFALLTLSKVLSQQVTFYSIDFSSHTDRGPPAA